MKTPFVLALDIGTTSTRALLFDAAGQPVPDCIAQVANHLETTQEGGASFQPDHLFDHVIAVIDQVLQRAGDRAKAIGAVVSDTFVGNVMGVNGAGEPVTPLFIYADTRNAADAEQIRHELGATGLRASHDRTGCLIHTSYLPARFRWLARTQPEWFNRSAYWLSFGEYLYWQLLGQRAVSYSVAAWTGMLNRRSLTWDQDWLAALPVQPAQLSPLVDVNQPLQGLLSPWADRWPALRGIPWYPAIGDGAAANLGSGCDRPTRIALTIGTTGAMRVVVDPSLAQVPDGLWLYRVAGHQGLLGGATTEGGNLFAWLRESMQLPATDELEKELAAREPAAHGLTVLPFVAGERAPGWHERARASIIGFTLNTQPVDIVQAGLEAIAYRFSLIYRRVKPYLAAEQHQIIASGGGLLSSPAWLQIMADALGEPIVALTEKEITSRGIALLGLQQLGVIQQTSDLPPTTGQTYWPEATRHARHQQAIERQVALYDLLIARSV
ncbi:MAG: carbohydrate kinase [Caldilinea sp. CFX5]|nr:carbohydrate kinase [Caldilinea sp. CFX5]